MILSFPQYSGKRIPGDDKKDAKCMKYEWNNLKFYLELYVQNIRIGHYRL